MRRLSAAILLATFSAAGCQTASAPVAPAAAVESRQPGAVRVDQARIDAALKGFVDRGNVAGVSGLVFQNGKEAYFGTFGMADREAARPMARDTLVQIFSMTKPIAGTALMQLYEQGKFRMDDPLALYLPEFAATRVYAGKDAAGNTITEPQKRPITIRDVTRHTAGFANGGEAGPAEQLARDAKITDISNTLSELGSRMARTPLVAQPGERWLYSPAVDIQALLVERISGQPFDVYVREHILTPLGMNETRYVVPAEEMSRFARPYRRSDDNVLTPLSDEEAYRFNSREWPQKPGSFGFTATIDNYMRFARMLQNEGELDGVRILKPETVRLMASNQLDPAVTDRYWLPTKGQMGFGVNFAVRLRPPADASEKSGAVGEFFWDGAASTLFWVDPANDVTAVLFVQLFPFDKVGLQKAFRDAIYAGSTAAAPLPQ